MDWLEKENIPYEEVDATNMPDIQAVPVTEINGERIIGFDRPAIKRALAAAKTTESAAASNTAETTDGVTATSDADNC